MSSPPQRKKPARQRRNTAGAENKSLVPTKSEAVEIPPESIQILEGIGVDPRSPEELQRFVTSLQMSVSSSPYPSPDMLFSYDPMKPGFSNHIIATIDGQRDHRQKLESEKVTRQEKRLDRSQRNAFILAIFGIAVSVAANYFGVDRILCVSIAIVSVGGPSTASVLSRMVPREKN